jgi:multidrug efflux pump
VSAIIPSVAVPLSLIGTFGVMYCRLLDQQPDTDGADDRDGFVVDDAIVMIENIALHREGEKPRRALKGSRADRLHDHLADDLADRGADPAAVHGDVVGRLFRDSRSRWRSILISAWYRSRDADDVARLSAHTPKKAGPLLSQERRALRSRHRALR